MLKCLWMEVILHSGFGNGMKAFEMKMSHGKTATIEYDCEGVEVEQVMQDTKR